MPARGFMPPWQVVQYLARSGLTSSNFGAALSSFFASSARTLLQPNASALSPRTNGSSVRRNPIDRTPAVSWRELRAGFTSGGTTKGIIPHGSQEVPTGGLDGPSSPKAGSACADALRLRLGHRLRKRPNGETHRRAACLPLN